MTLLFCMGKKLWIGVDGTGADLALGGMGVYIHKPHLHTLECLPYHLLSLGIIGLNPTIENAYINFVL